MSQRTPPVLSRQNARPIALPQRAVPLVGGLPPRLVGQKGISPYTPSADDIRSTIVPDQTKRNQGGEANVLLDGTYVIQAPGWVQVAHLSLDKARPMNVYVGPTPETQQDTLTQLFARLTIARGKAYQRYFFDIPIYLNPTNNALDGGALVCLPVVGRDADLWVKAVATSSNTAPSAWANIDINNPPDVAQPGTTIPYSITAYISEGEAVPRDRYPGRHVVTKLSASGTSVATVNVAYGCDRVWLTADPTVGTTFTMNGPAGFTIPNLPPNTLIPIMTGCQSFRIVGGSGVNTVELIQYLSL